MNNSVKNGYGEIVGFRCWTCGGVFQSMWGTTCNMCRERKDGLEAQLTEMRKANETLSMLLAEKLHNESTRDKGGDN